MQKMVWPKCCRIKPRFTKSAEALVFSSIPPLTRFAADAVELDLSRDERQAMKTDEVVGYAYEEKPKNLAKWTVLFDELTPKVRALILAGERLKIAVEALEKIDQRYEELSHHEMGELQIIAQKALASIEYPPSVVEPVGH